MVFRFNTPDDLKAFTLEHSPASFTVQNGKLQVVLDRVASEQNPTMSFPGFLSSGLWDGNIEVSPW